MIDSGIYTKSTLFTIGDIQAQDFNIDNSSTTVNKSSMYHLVCSHICQILKDQKIQQTLKQKFVYQFGFKLGYNIAEEECYGYAKYCIPKPDGKKQKYDNKEFVGEMKILHGKIWNILVGNKGKLYAINNQNNKGVCYKIEDKEFTLGKSIKKPINPQQKQFRKILIQFCLGFIKGALQKFDLGGDVICDQGAEGSIFAQLKNLQKKNAVNSYNQYSKSAGKQINFTD